MMARPGVLRVRSWPIMGCSVSTPVSDSRVGARSIWLIRRSSRRGSMPAPRITAGIWKCRTGTRLAPNTRESWSAATRNTVFSQYGEALARSKKRPSAQSA